MYKNISKIVYVACAAVVFALCASQLAAVSDGGGGMGDSGGGGGAGAVQAHWAQSGVDALTGAGILKGGEFGVDVYDSPINRSTLTDLLARLIPDQAAENSKPVAEKARRFTDVQESDPLYASIIKGAETGLIMGYPDGSFRPGDSIERQDLFTIAGRALENKLLSVDISKLSNAGGKTFNDDAEISDYAKPYVYMLAGNSLIIGYADGTVRPKSDITYAETFTIVNRLYSFIKSAGEPKRSPKPAATPPKRTAMRTPKPTPAATPTPAQPVKTPATQGGGNTGGGASGGNSPGGNNPGGNNPGGNNPGGNNPGDNNPGGNNPGGNNPGGNTDPGGGDGGNGGNGGNGNGGDGGNSGNGNGGDGGNGGNGNGGDGGDGGNGGGGTVKTPKSVEYIESQVAKYDHRRYVYKDFCAGENMYTQKLFMSDYASINVPEMDEAAEGYSGISGIGAYLDLTKHLWGGYMFTNGELKAGSHIPGADSGNLKDAVDLTGASKLVFYARGKTGNEKVEFFTAGLGWQYGQVLASAEYPDSSDKITLDYVKLNSEWTRYEIPLLGRDLSRINCGFGWVTNDRNNIGASKVEFNIDEIYYEYPEPINSAVFLNSFAPAGLETDDYITNNFAFSYDNSMALMALCYAGKYDRAKQIADAFVFAINNDREYTDGRVRNAYSDGFPRNFPNWFGVNGGETFARMPGFMRPGNMTWYEDRFTVSTHTGNAAWVIMGLMEAYNSMKDAAYLQAAQKVGNFIWTTQKAPDGGFTGGFEGWDSQKLTYKSTEHNIDLISAYALLAQHSGVKMNDEYNKASKHAKEFVLSMYDPDRGCFYTGTEPDGVTVSKEIIPLDVNTWAIMAMPDFADGKKVMAFVEANMRNAEGYSFFNQKNGIWYEGTAQAALTYKLLGDGAMYGGLMEYLLQSSEPDGSIVSADRNYIETGFDWRYGKRVHLGATAWVAFAELGRNPFAVK